MLLKYLQHLSVLFRFRLQYHHNWSIHSSSHNGSRWSWLFIGSPGQKNDWGDCPKIWHEETCPKASGHVFRPRDQTQDHRGQMRFMFAFCSSCWFDFWSFGFSSLLRRNSNGKWCECVCFFLWSRGARTRCAKYIQIHTKWGLWGVSVSTSSNKHMSSCACE